MHYKNESAARLSNFIVESMCRFCFVLPEGLGVSLHTWTTGHRKTSTCVHDHYSFIHSSTFRIGHINNIIGHLSFVGVRSAGLLIKSARIPLYQQFVHSFSSFSISLHNAVGLRPPLAEFDSPLRCIGDTSDFPPFRNSAYAVIAQIDPCRVGRCLLFKFLSNAK